MPNFPGESSSGSALDTIQDINSATSTTVAAWGSTIPTVFTATGQSLTLPTIATSDIGKTCTIPNNGTSAFTLAIASGSITSAIGLIVNSGSTFIVKAVSTTSAIVVSTNAAQNVVPDTGTAYLTANQSIAATNNSVATALALVGMQFVAKETAKYHASFKLHTNQTVANQNFVVALYDTLTPTVAIAGSETLVATPGATGEYSGSGTFELEAIAGRTYQARAFSTAGTTAAALITNANGRSSLAWQKVSGAVPVTGQSVASGQVVLNNQVFNSPTFVASTNGVYVIPSAGTWILRYDVFTDGTGVTPTASMFAITDSAGVVVDGTERARGGSSTAGECISAEAIVTTTGATNYFFRGRSVPSGSVTVRNGAVGQSTINWQQLGTSALVGVAGATGVLTLPSVGAISKGRPVEWFNNAGTPSVRDCLQGTPGLSSPFDLTIGNAAASECSCVVPGNFNTNFFVRADNSGLVVNKHLFAANGSLSSSSAGSTTIPANIALINGAHAIGTNGNESYAAFAISDNSSQNYFVGVNTSTASPTVGSISGGYGGQRSCVCPSSRSTGNGFWYLVSSGATHTLYENTLATSGNISVQSPSLSLTIGTMQGSGQPTQIYAMPNTPGTRDNLWVFMQNSAGALIIGNWASNLGATTLGTGGLRTLSGVNSSVGAMQAIPVRVNGGTMNIAYISSSGQLIIAYVDGNSTGAVANISSAFIPPNFPGGFDAARVQICPKNFTIHNLQNSTVSSGATIAGGGTSRFVLSYTAPSATQTFYCDVSFNWVDLTFTTNFTQSIGHPEAVNGIEAARPSSLQGTLTDAACFFIHRVAGSGNDRYRNIVAGSTSVSSNVFAIAGADTANGVGVPLLFNGDTITGLTGLTPGAKTYLNTANGTLTTSNSGVPLLHALDSARAVVKLNP